MKKILYTMMGVGMLFAATSCEDFLDTSSPSEADVDFVFSEASTARAALYNAYEKWRGNAGVHSNGVFYDLVVCGSDAERHPEAYASQIARHPITGGVTQTDRFQYDSPRYSVPV